MDIAYDGTAYAGWQVQPNGVTIQEKLEGAIARLTAEKTKVHGSGRTDTGVHARCQVAHFDLEKKPASAASFLRSLNALLPPDIRVLRLRKAAPAFHARRDAAGKEYRYFIWNSGVLMPFRRNHATHVWQKLDVAAMRKAAACLTGQHDFAAFTANPHREVASTVRNLRKLTIVKRGAEIVITARADGFLYRMVRSLAGFLIRVGEGAVPPEAARSILNSRERTARVPTAPPQGLFLWNVFY